ncbi:hypothetical protein QZH41_019625 [Actinostola sp. cb2023]|nr:hypothetical protein QZH41_019625 [Actinostola sp. cb2023]
MISKELVIPHDKGLYPHWCKGFDEYLCSHSISQHMSKLHKHDFVITSPTSVFNARIKAIRRILRKMPFERKSKENDALYKHLMSLPDMSDQADPRVLEELCAVAQLDKWTDEGCTDNDYIYKNDDGDDDHGGDDIDNDNDDDDDNDDNDDDDNDYDDDNDDNDYDDDDDDDNDDNDYDDADFLATQVFI